MAGRYWRTVLVRSRGIAFGPVDGTEEGSVRFYGRIYPGPRPIIGLGAPLPGKGQNFQNFPPERFGSGDRKKKKERHIDL